MFDQFPVYAFLLTLFAGLSTGIGSVIGLLAKRTNTRFLSLSLGFSAGVMIYVAFAEILPEGRACLAGQFGERAGAWAITGAFFGGMLLIALIDKLVPSGENPHEARFVEEMRPQTPTMPTVPSVKGGFHARREVNTEKLKHTGLVTALAIGVHNFPEGLATFTAALGDPALGLAIAVAVAIHNIPEGIAVSVPIYHATGSRKKAFSYSFLSGLAEPFGALLGFLLLRPFFTPTLMGVLFGLVSGIMVFISIDELLPAAEEYGEHHLCIYGLVSGMGVMALSLLLLG